jgi:hypothetical protein
MFRELELAVKQIGGTVNGIGAHRAIYVTLPDGEDLVLYPTVCVPTSVSMFDAVTRADRQPSAVLYDPVGLHPDWIKHLDWLGDNIESPRWLRKHEAAWQLADWQV